MSESISRFHVELVPYEPKNWLTPFGIRQVRRYYEPRFPELANARFITLTIDRKQFDSPQGAYEVGKKRIRKTMARLREEYGVGATEAPFCWKLEFQDGGWPHWHLIWLYRQRIDFDVLDRAWTLGDTNCKRIHPKRGFDYIFKYVTKEGELPDWVLDYCGTIRFFQTSKGFLRQLESGEEENDGREELGQGLAREMNADGSLETPEEYACRVWAIETEQASAWVAAPSPLLFRCFCAVVTQPEEREKLTIRQKLLKWARQACAVEIDETGKRFFLRLPLSATYAELRDKTALDLAECGGFLGAYKVALKTLKQWKKWIQRKTIKPETVTAWQLSLKLEGSF